MWLILLIKAYLGWAFSIFRRIVALAAPQLCLVVVFTIVSQLARLLAFFLPLKIIILIGSEGVPRYFPRAFLHYEREPLVIWLGLATIGFYIAYLIAEKVVSVFTEASAERVIASTAKLTLFENQDEIVGNACCKLAESIAAVVFGVLAILLLAYVYPLVAAVIVGWIGAALVGTALAGMASPGFRAWLEVHAGDFIDSVSALGFFTVTATIVAKFIAGIELPILFAIIAVLLTRQLLQRIGKSFGNALSLYPKRFLVNALFLRSHHLPTAPKPENGRVWDLVTTNPPEDWLPELLLEATGEEVATAAMAGWHETGVVDILAFDARAVASDGVEAFRLVKLFGRRRGLAALHEATLMASMEPDALPAPAFLGSGLVGDHHCHVFERPGGDPLQKNELGEVRLDLMADCWQCRPPGDLVQRYRRSHQFLGQRLAAIDLERLALAVAKPREAAQLAAFGKGLEKIREVLGNMPVAILNPDLKPQSLARLEDGRPVATQWGRWRLEPVGAGWPCDDEELEQLPLWLDKAREQREDLSSVRPEDAQLAALLYEFEVLTARQRYRSAMDLLPSIMRRAKKSAVGGLRL